MPPISASAFSTTARALPQPQPIDAQTQFQRCDRYGGLTVGLSSRRQAADEGAYFIATNPTPGTAIQVAAINGSRTLVSTDALFVIFNGNPAAGGKRIYLDRMKLLLAGTAPTGTTLMNGDVSIDSLSRLPTANTTLITPVNVNGDDNTVSRAVVWFPLTSMITAPAASSAARLVSRWQFTTSLGIVGDVYELVFGSESVGSGAGAATAVRATHPCRIVEYAPPAIIGPQQWCVIRAAFPTAATNAWSMEFELAYIEK